MRSTYTQNFSPARTLQLILYLNLPYHLPTPVGIPEPRGLISKGRTTPPDAMRCALAWIYKQTALPKRPSVIPGSVVVVPNIASEARCLPWASWHYLSGPLFDPKPAILNIPYCKALRARGAEWKVLCSDGHRGTHRHKVYHGAVLVEHLGVPPWTIV